MSKNYGHIDIVDANGQSSMDSVTGALNVIDYGHHEVHEGSSFVVSDVQNISSTTIQYMITTPDSAKLAHMIFDIEATGELLITITEGADRDGTTALNVFNNRRGSRASFVLVHRAVSGGSGDGATIWQHRSGSTGVGNKTISGGGSRGLNEWILKADTKYIVTLQTFANIYITFGLDWYEHQDRA